MFFWDPTFILIIPALFFAGWAQLKVKTTFNEYARVRAQSGYTGYDAAKAILEANGIYDVSITQSRGHLSDHYDPEKKVLRLSENVSQGTSLAALGVAAHEAGHAMQHAQGYFPLHIRSFVYPVAHFGSFAAWPLFFMGFLFGFPLLMNLGILVFAAAALFQIATLPVEIDASRRAIVALTSRGIVLPQEKEGARRVLDAAALTYVAALIMAVMQLMRLIVLRGMRD